MNAIDQITSGDEPIVRAIEEEQGFLEAERFVNMFNNACLQVAGFEIILSMYANRCPTSIAPITNLSYLEH